MSDKENIALAKRYFDEVIDAHNPEAARNLLVENFTIITPANTHFGREDFIEYLKLVFAAWSGFKMTIHKVTADGDFVNSEVTVEGTRVKEFLTIPADFKKFDFDATGRFKIRNGLIESLIIEYDFAKLLKRE